MDKAASRIRLPHLETICPLSVPRVCPLNSIISRCSKLIAYINLINQCNAFKCLYALFWPVCPSLIGRVARYTPSSELNIQTKIRHKSI